MAIQYYEYKYVVPPAQMPLAVSLLDRFYGDTDPFPQGRVDSLYYESLDHRCLRECEAGEGVKRKFRLRGYDGKGYVSAQAKERYGAGVFKYKASFRENIQPPEEFRDLDQYDSCRGNPLLILAAGYPLLRPYVRVVYHRRRFRAGEARLTLDSDISLHSPEGSLLTKRSLARLPWGVLEIKTMEERPYLPFLGILKLSSASFSKFYLASILLRTGKEDHLNNYAA